MNIEIDQSGKVERTNKRTVVAAVGKGWKRSVRINPRDKRYLKKIFRQAGQPRIFMSKVFASLVFYLIRTNYKKFSIITIDKEYPGHERYIRNQILGILTSQGYKADRIIIYFKQIGKTSPAHGLSIQEYRKPNKSKLLKARDILKVI